MTESLVPQLNPGDSEPPIKPSRRHPKANVYAHMASIGMAVAAIITAISQINKPAPPEVKADAVYKALAGEVQRMSHSQQQQHDDLVALRSWLTGYLAATGVKIAEPAGSPPVERVQIDVEPAPTSSVAAAVMVPPRRPGTAAMAKPVGVKVLTPLPTTAPRPTAAQLPANADALR